jgi:hypothetical protein
VAAELGCNQSRTGTTYTGVALIDDYPCLAEHTTGSELAYRLVAPPSGSVTIALEEVTGTAQLVVLGANTVDSACDLAHCTAATDNSITIPAMGQTLYILVDTPSRLGAEVTLTTTCE